MLNLLLFPVPLIVRPVWPYAFSFPFLQQFLSAFFVGLFALSSLQFDCCCTLFYQQPLWPWPPYRILCLFFPFLQGLRSLPYWSTASLFFKFLELCYCPCSAFSWTCLFFSFVPISLKIRSLTSCLFSEYNITTSADLSKIKSYFLFFPIFCTSTKTWSCIGCINKSLSVKPGRLAVQIYFAGNPIPPFPKFGFPLPVLRSTHLSSKHFFRHEVFLHLGYGTLPSFNSISCFHLFALAFQLLGSFPDIPPHSPKCIPYPHIRCAHPTARWATVIVTMEKSRPRTKPSNALCIHF